MLEVVESEFAACKQRLARLQKLSLQEVSGSIGDLGTFIPLVVAVSVNNGVNFASTLFFAGLMNFLTGLTFDVPMPVQPMKAISAVALSSNLTANEALAGGIVTSIVVFVLGVTQLVEVLHKIVPLSVVRGMQLGLGIVLCKKAAGFCVFDASGELLGAGELVWVGVLFLLSFLQSPRIPIVLCYFIGGLIWAIVMYNSKDDAAKHDSYNLFWPSAVHLSASDFKNGALKAAIPQIPLTTLNSVIAVCRLSDDLFPHIHTTGPRKVATSVGLMNLVQCWFGGFPMCHGAGGLAGQYRCGARSNSSVLFLGLCKFIFAVFAGNLCLDVLKRFPNSVLGVLLAMSGLELASSCKDQNKKRDVIIMLVTAGGNVCFNSQTQTKTVSSALGAGLGLLVCLFLRLVDEVQARFPATQLLFSPVDTHTLETTPLQQPTATENETQPQE